MSILDALAQKLGFIPSAEWRRMQADLRAAHETLYRERIGRRAYAAAAGNRLLADWITSPVTADADIRAGLVALRARARDLAQNNDLAKAYLRALKKNVVGATGFALQVKAVNWVNGQPIPDEADSDYIERAFRAWSAPETATVTRQLSFRKVQELVLETVARDGDVFVVMLRGRDVNEFGFTLQIVEPDYVDEKYNEVLPNGNVVVMGVEMTTGRRPVAYHFAERKDRLGIWGAHVIGPPYRRVPAEDVIHIYDPERADQTRGVTWLAQGMVNAHQLRGYIEATVVAARGGACHMGFLQDPGGGAEEYLGSGTDASGATIRELTPGLIEDIGRKQFVPYDPKFPQEVFEPFVKAMIRLIASGLGVSYQTLSGDLSDTSYASGRQGLLDERETYRSIQEFLREKFLDRVFAEWLTMAILTGRLNLPLSKFAKFNAPKWTGRRWSWVDPVKDVEAARTARAAGFKSATQIIAEAGGEIEDIYREIAAENALAQSLGIRLDFSGAGKSAEAESPPAAPQKAKGNGKGIGIPVSP